ncbi:unnamed protein product [Clonostachys rosea f. rosea IK726]|uniref:Peptidase A1 domain-containing protein n=2 Tax=Bionectria ochroleuca TaxID=29856 RepID=A0A0B7KA69_BIOOC|nr:unnamed protein product [Clonostachys rosea f. rosea IK726]
MPEPWLLSWASTRGYWGILVAVALLAASLAEGASCVPKPLVMPIGNVTLGPTQVRRGVSIKLGSPSQELSVLPSWHNNNTIVYGPTCLDKKLTTEKCRSDKGGLYDPSKSKTAGTVNSDYKPVSDHNAITPDSYSLFTDNLTLTDDYFIQDFPMMRALNESQWGYGGYRPQHILGMNTGSTILQALYSAKAIASRSWGYYYGREARNDNTAGSFILGGYDRAKTYGDGYTRNFEITDNCPSSMVVTIQNIVLNLANGTDVSVFPKTSGGQGLMACVHPEKPVLFDMPADPYFNTWSDILGYNLELRRSIGIDFWNEILPQKGYDGGLTFDFGSGFRISIPNNQLVVPDRIYNDKGELWANSSANVLRINALTDVTATAFPALGRYFFQQAYIMANHETRQFTIWQLNPTSIQDLVVVNDKNKVVSQDTYCANRTIATETASPSASSPTNTNEAKNEDSAESGTTKPLLGTGAIAGIAVGGVALVIIAIAAIWGLCYRRKRAAQRLLQEQQMREPFPISDVPKEPTPNYEELWPSQGQPHYIPQEMAANRPASRFEEMITRRKTPPPQEMAVPREAPRPPAPPAELPATPRP